MSFTVLKPDQVAELLRGPTRERLVVVDVRDDDFSGKGGHIRGAINFPVDHFEEKSEIDAFILERLSAGNLDRVIVHCYLCEERGPSCAKKLASRLQCLERSEPQVFIVEGGFKRFQQLYGDDPELVAADDEDSGSAASTDSADVAFPESCCYPGHRGGFTLTHAY